MKNFVATLTAWGPAGLLLFSALDGAGVPMPGGVDVLIVYLASTAQWSMWLLVLAAVAGSVAGNLVLFAIARKGGQAYLDRRTQHGRTARFRRWFHHYGLLTVFIAALVPLPVMPMKIFTLCSGALGTSIPAFVGVLGLARVLRYSGLAYLGSLMGTNALPYLRSHVKELALIALLLFIVLYGMVKLIDLRRARAARPSN
jgi:membrane protein DedA with SNARE-associated domain